MGLSLCTSVCHLFHFFICTCIDVYVVWGGAHEQACTFRDQRLTCDIFLHHSSHFLFETDLFLNLKLSYSAWLSCQQAPGIDSSLPSSFWNYRHTSPKPDFLWPFTNWAISSASLIAASYKNINCVSHKIHSDELIKPQLVNLCLQIQRRLGSGLQQVF